MMGIFGNGMYAGQLQTAQPSWGALRMPWQQWGQPMPQPPQMQPSGITNTMGMQPQPMPPAYTNTMGMPAQMQPRPQPMPVPTQQPPSYTNTMGMPSQSFGGLSNLPKALPPGGKQFTPVYGGGGGYTNTMGMPRGIGLGR